VRREISVLMSAVLKAFTMASAVWRSSDAMVGDVEYVRVIVK
jgi:hypothetical protein